MLGATPALAYRFGSEPLDDVLTFANAERSCGVSREGLASLMVSVTFFETGAGANSTPSPMTMSRSDTHSGLYESNSTSTPYRQAFWHPGVGMFQLDSAGIGRAYNAAQRVSSLTSSQVTAREMSRLYCQSGASTEAGRRASAWRPWVACRASSNPCESAFQTIWQGGGRPLNITRDSSVARWGGTVSRQCYQRTDPGQPRFTCYFINPGSAQGHVAWRTSSFGPSPITKPFYSYTHSGNGLEYRHWLRVHTGYSTGIYGRRPRTENERGSITWIRNQVLCDRTATLGNCNHL